MRLLPRRRAKRLNVKRFTENWKALQKHCATRKTWPLALTEADVLLDKALKQRRFKGKTTGERLVAAQHELGSNSAVWFSHKYCQRMEDIDVRTMKKKQVAEALAGFRQALRDLGALE
jgi:tryptophan 2,3-dioxygenase